MSGALKDLKRAVLVGEQTFGKGSVQTVQSLGGGIGVRITTARYFTPSGQSIHEIGVTPDIVVPITNRANAAPPTRRKKSSRTYGTSITHPG